MKDLELKEKLGRITLSVFCPEHGTYLPAIVTNVCIYSEEKIKKVHCDLVWKPGLNVDTEDAKITNKCVLQWSDNSQKTIPEECFIGLCISWIYANGYEYPALIENMYTTNDQVYCDLLWMDNQEDPSLKGIAFQNILEHSVDKVSIQFDRLSAKLHNEFQQKYANLNEEFNKKKTRIEQLETIMKRKFNTMQLELDDLRKKMKSR